MEDDVSLLHTIHLARLPLFRNVPLELLEVIQQEGTLCFYNDGDAIFHQGDEANSLVLLLHGQVRILADGIFLVSRTAYEVIGEQAFINRTVRSATVLAQGMVKALILSRSLVERCLANTTFARNLLECVSHKLREATTERAFRFRNEQLLFSEFTAHLSPEITQRLLATGLSYGEPRYIDSIILFADIRSFTEQSAGMPPAQIAHQLSLYFDAMVTLIHYHEGLVDKFIGDAMIALWGFAPGTEDPVLQAWNCAHAMINTATHMTFGDQPLTIGIGLNAGQVFLGNVGGKGKRQFTVIGMPVNLAARYESETKVLQTQLVIGQALYYRLSPEQQASLVLHENWPIKGVNPQTIYTL